VPVTKLKLAVNPFRAAVDDAAAAAAGRLCDVRMTYKRPDAPLINMAGGRLSAQ